MFLGFLKRFKASAPVRVVASTRNMNRIANILEDIQGVGLRIVKRTDAEGRGWLIINDGSSDVTLPEDAEKERRAALSSGIGGFPNGNKWTWGISYSGDVVTIYNPKVVTGYTVAYPADPTPLQITANNYWLYYKFTIADSTGVLKSAATVPDSTATYVYVPLYRIQWADAVVGPPAVAAHITGWDRDRAHDSMAMATCEIVFG